MRIESWNGNKIRFIEKDGQWWAVAKDICDALGLKQVTRALSGLPTDGVTIIKGVSKTTNQHGKTTEQEVDLNTINEKAIYQLVFKSRKQKALEFQSWIFDVIKELRQSIGLEGFEIFLMLDKEHQKEAMANLRNGLRKAAKIDYIKANTIANKAVSIRYGYDKSLKKANMSPEMLMDRQPILDDTVRLMEVKDNFNLGISVSDTIYAKYN